MDPERNKAAIMNNSKPVRTGFRSTVILTGKEPLFSRSVEVRLTKDGSHETGDFEATTVEKRNVLTQTMANACANSSLNLQSRLANGGRSHESIPHSDDSAASSVKMSSEMTSLVPLSHEPMMGGCSPLTVSRSSLKDLTRGSSSSTRRNSTNESYSSKIAVSALSSNDDVTRNKYSMSRTLSFPDNWTCGSSSTKVDIMDDTFFLTSRRQLFANKDDGYDNYLRQTRLSQGDRRLSQGDRRLSSLSEPNQNYRIRKFFESQKVTDLKARLLSEKTDFGSTNNEVLPHQNLGSLSATSTFQRLLRKCHDKYRHMGGKKLRRRIVQKSGECNIIKSNVAKRRKRFLQDIFTTMLDIQWRWTFLIFALSFVLSWTLFAAVWYVIVYCHGDLMPEHLPERQAETGWTPCVMNVFNFASCFLFSVETQHTIGYGSRHTTEECPEAIFVMCIQSITGVILQAFMGGVIFTKLSRPKKRTHTLIFSREACVCQRDGELCLLFRVGDMRKSHIIEAHIRVQMIKERVTEEGEVIPFFQHEMDVGYDGGEDRLLFIWPMTIVHKIDESSPLYEISAHDLPREKFEIIVMLEGVIENTGMTIQARSSYLPTEIRWGCRFRPLVNFKEESGDCTVDYSLFNDFFEIETPKCSAKDLEQEDSSKNSTPAIPSTPISPISPYTLTMPSSKTLEGIPQSETESSSSSAGSSVRTNVPNDKSSKSDVPALSGAKTNVLNKQTAAASSTPEENRIPSSVSNQVEPSLKKYGSVSCQPLLNQIGRV